MITQQKIQLELSTYMDQRLTDGTLAYGEETVYKLSDKFLAEMKDLAGGNHINYLRQYVGATLPIGHIRSLGLEFQTLSEEGTLGIERINTAVKAGTLLLAGQTGKKLKKNGMIYHQHSSQFQKKTKNQLKLQQHLEISSKMMH